MSLNFVLLLPVSFCLWVYCVRSQTIEGSSPLAISPQNCFSSFECPADKFCFANEPYTPLYRCVARYGLGEGCDYDGSQSTDPEMNEASCMRGQVCAYNGDTFTCARPIATGDLCGKDGNKNEVCPRGDVCEKGKDNKMRCGPPKKGGIGSPCSPSGCSEELDLLCKNKVCVPKGQSGTPCKNKWECASNICAGGKKCAPLQREGQMCLRDKDCRSSGLLFQDGDNVYCNKEYTYTEFDEGPTAQDLGRCIRDSRLIKTLGTKCSPKYDRCDHRRGLACEWIWFEKRFGCQQRKAGNYCTPKNKYSRCLPSEYRRECFLARDSGRWWESNSRFYQCNPQKEKVPIGYPCNRAPIEPDCPTGATCEEISGVLQPGPIMYGPPYLTACVYLRDLGQSCGSKFEQKCKRGLKCENGKCVKGDEPYERNPTHADFGNSCATIPCIPGAVCVRGTCLKPTKVSGANEPCAETIKSLIECQKPLRCLPDMRGKGLKLCRKPHAVGGHCSENADCESGLKCSPSGWYGYYKVRKCYNEKKALKIGDKCDPNARPDEKQCFGPSGLTCLPKGSGHVCQATVNLHEFCAPDKNIVCKDPRLTCDKTINACL